MHVVLIALSIAGLYISLYFTLVSYRLIVPDVVFVPAFCRMDKSTCQLVVHHPDAAVLGLPNSLLGIGYYLFLILVGIGIDSPTMVLSALLSSWVAVALGVYLVYALFLKIKALCLLCLLSHILNLVIALWFTLWW